MLRIGKIIRIVQRPTAITMLILFFSFLFIRNHSVFAIADVYDGALIKSEIISQGINWNGFEWYVDKYVLAAFNNAFQPVWFLLFYGLVWLDTQPFILGVLSFLLAAIILYCVYAIVLHVFRDHKKAAPYYALLCALIFSGTLFFLEMIAWKWMSLLLLTTASFLCCLLLILRSADQPPAKYGRIMYALILLAGMWSFGTGWVLAWGLAAFLLMKKYVLGLRAPYLWTTVGIACAGLATAFIANTESVSHNFVFVLVYVPAMALAVLAQSISGFLGVFRFTSFDMTFMPVASIAGYGLIIGLAYYYGRKVAQRTFTEFDAIVVSLSITYLALIALSLLRVMPDSGLTPLTSVENYIFGNRYIFAFSTPLFLALALVAGRYAVRWSRPAFSLAIAGALVLGCAMQIIYPRTDPFIANQDRTMFYHQTLNALRTADRKDLILPNVRSDILFAGTPLTLQQSIATRKDAVAVPVVFAEANTLPRGTCDKLMADTTIRTWLDSFGSTWCGRTP